MRALLQWIVLYTPQILLGSNFTIVALSHYSWIVPPPSHYFWKLSPPIALFLNVISTTFYHSTLKFYHPLSHPFSIFSPSIKLRPNITIPLINRPLHDDTRGEFSRQGVLGKDTWGTINCFILLQFFLAHHLPLSPIALPPCLGNIMFGQHFIYLQDFKNTTVFFPKNGNLSSRNLESFSIRYLRNCS